VGAVAVTALWPFSGCASGPRFPAPVESHRERDETVLAFDTNGDGHADYWQYEPADGRKHAVAFAADHSDQPGPRIDLDGVAASAVPHFIIALDGVPFEVVDDLYRAGRFRLFHPPSRIICCFPAMTDLALAELFHTEACLACQAQYFDAAANRLSNGNTTYVSGGNSPWLKHMNYRCSLWWDAKVYLDPQAVFDHELAGIADAFRKVDAGEACGYSVGSAGLGTRGGRPAMEAYLRAIDDLCEQIVYERHGRVKITLTADHGHDLVPNRRIAFDDVLKAGGYRLTKTLRGPRDVVEIRYGLVTYAELHTHDPAGVALCLLGHPDVDLTCYPEDDAVVVCNGDGRARVRQGARGFIYDASQGDPLRLEPIVAQLRRDGKVSADGEIDAQALFDATVEHEYPDPLARLWHAFHGLVVHPPDVIASLRDGACHGSRFFYLMIGNQVASTHGSLNRMNSTTFVLTMLGHLPPALRTSEVLPALTRLRERR
jgi:hypothetical protein